MVGVPYATLGFVGFLIYRGCKKNAAYLQQHSASDGLSCHRPNHPDVSG
jgi:hypothetical protein